MVVGVVLASAVTSLGIRRTPTSEDISPVSPAPYQQTTEWRVRRVRWVEGCPTHEFPFPVTQDSVASGVHRPMLHRRRLSAQTATLGILSLVAVSCGPSRAPTSPPREIVILAAAPPQPGSSISHTKLCTCRSCSSGCCDGEPETEDLGTCGSNDYDFSECTLGVSSCEGRCGQFSWRVALSDPCAPETVSECCESG